MNIQNDKTLREGLYMTLFNSSPTQTIKTWLKGEKEAYREIQKNFEYDLPKVYHTRYSIDDSVRLSQILKNDYLNSNSRGIFDLIFDFSYQTLVEREHRPLLRYEEVLRWRNTTHDFGTTPFVCAFLAKQDSKKCEERYMFSFSPVLHTDNNRLNAVLNQGMAENHFHLKGSAPSFLLSWISLMNDMKSRKESFKVLDEVKLSDRLYDSEISTYVLIMKAAAIRAYLFLKLNDTKVDDDLLSNILKIETPIECRAYVGELQSEINSLKDTYGIFIETGFRPDYAITYLGETSEEHTFDLLSGEYYFQYKMFQAIWKNDKNLKPYYDLFYAYLSIGVMFRSELVQSNKHFGFQNFCEFDHRKSGFLKNDQFKKAQKKIAALTNLNDKRIESLEARIVPQFTSLEISNSINEIDGLFKNSPVWEGQTNDYNQKSRMFYVLHIPKRKDTTKVGSNCEYIHCRHHEWRVKTDKVIESVIKLREGCNPAASRIKGIDACANELYTRPEVFACAYRKIKNHQPIRIPSRERAVSMMNITYHVGEDFLDIVDGLRAIWEAIEFMELGHSDRIGHALALGINADEWYSCKQNRIFITRQDLLDNCVWILEILCRYGNIDRNLENELEHIASTQYTAIYQYTLPFQEREVSYNRADYFKSIELRGDNPYCYLDYQNNDKYRDKLKYFKLVDPFNLRDDEKHSACYETRRYNFQAIRLYHHYHFNPETKHKGAETIEYQVSKQYIKAVSDVQKIIQNIIAEKGIGIETNPTSNVLIGNFNRYDKHPILIFNDQGLFDNPNNPNLFVSINTDDQGVFDTCLENEYALLARSIDKMTDENGKPIVSADRIYAWLDHIRRMGIEQSFCNNSK